MDLNICRREEYMKNRYRKIIAFIIASVIPYGIAQFFNSDTGMLIYLITLFIYNSAIIYYFSFASFEKIKDAFLIIAIVIGLFTVIFLTQYNSSALVYLIGYAIISGIGIVNKYYNNKVKNIK